MFGAPEFAVKVDAGRIAAIEVVRGAPCGATWDAALRVMGLPVAEAAVRIGLEVQYFCVADPSAWDPISGRSPVHLAGEFHKAALKKALKSAFILMKA
jgi:hypothetical protein